MKVRWTQLCVMFLLFLVPLGMASCSSDQQGVQEAVNANGQESNQYDDDYGDEDGEESAESEYDYGNEENAEGNSNYADEYGNSENGNADVYGNDSSTGNYAGNDVMDSSNIVDNALAGAIEEDPTPMEPNVNGSSNLVETAQTVDSGEYVNAQPAQASPAALPEWGSKMPYIVKKGDTLGDIAARIYGNRAKWREMSELSSLINPNLIYVGDVVYYQLTQETVAFATAYESLPRQEVVVQEGDTLSTIAARVLNKASDWKHIWRQNDTVNDPDSLTAGTVLYYVSPGALSAAVEGNKATNNIQIVEESNVEVEDVKVTVELENSSKKANPIAAVFSTVNLI